MHKRQGEKGGQRGYGGLPSPSIQPLPPSGLTCEGQYTATKVAASRNMLMKKTRTRDGGGAPDLLYHHPDIGVAGGRKAEPQKRAQHQEAARHLLRQNHYNCKVKVSTDQATD